MTLSPSASAFLAVGEPLRSATARFLAPESLQVQRMCAALAAIADDDDLLALDQIDVGIPIIIDAHGNSFGNWLETCPASRGAQ